MRVVKDIAERGVALMEEYNKLHTNNEQQKQAVFIVAGNIIDKNTQIAINQLCSNNLFLRLR